VRYPSVPFGHRDEAAIEVLAQVLNGDTGRLHRALVEEQKIATSAFVRQDSRKYGGAFSFEAECKGEATPEQLEAAFYEQLAKLQAEPVTEYELQKVKNQVLADNFRRLESNFNLLIQLGYFEALGGWEYINVFPREMTAVTVEDIIRVANEYFAPERRSVAIYNRKAGLAPPAAGEDLSRFAPEPRAMLEQMLQFLPRESDVGKLEGLVAQIEKGLEEAPDDYREALTFLLGKVRERIAELQEGGK
jgi:hypothetical protein